MQRCLYLLRHGDSVEKKSGGHDKTRTLSEIGNDQVESIAAFINKKKIVIDQIVTSSATRTLQTTLIIRKNLGLSSKNVLESDKVYEASTIDLLGVVNTLDPEWKNVLLVGHNPGISSLADFLSGENSIAMGTGNLVAITFDDMAWTEVTKDSGVFLFHTDPQRAKK